MFIPAFPRFLPVQPTVMLPMDMVSSFRLTFLLQIFMNHFVYHAHEVKPTLDAEARLNFSDRLQTAADFFALPLDVRLAFVCHILPAGFKQALFNAVNPCHAPIAKTVADVFNDVLHALACGVGDDDRLL